MSSTPNLSIHGNQKTWILTCTMEVQTSPWPTHMAMAWDAHELSELSSTIMAVRLDASRLQQHRHTSRVQVPLSNVHDRVLVCQPLIWPQNPIGCEDNFVICLLKLFQDFFRPTSKYNIKTVSKKKKKSFRMHGSEFKYTMKKKIPKKENLESTQD